MKTIVAVCVYNRIENIKIWLECWKECNTGNAELVIIHNFYGDEKEKEKFKTLCDSHNVKYVPRNAQGFDIGAFQDVCKERLKGFPEWDKLLWCCDDTIPMTKDFITPFTDKLIEGVGVVCMDLSSSVRTHIRTTGFLIRKETAKKLVWEVDPITTKEDCYRFEHRDKVNWFYQQIINMGLKVVMADTREKSPLWDQGYLKGLKRGAEHSAAFPKRQKVLFIVPIFDAFPEIISSLICQTHRDWELLLIDDNPQETTTEAIIKATGDKRIKYIKRQRLEKWGHPHRKWALEEIKDGKFDADYIVISNGDNFHVPTFCEYLLKGFTDNPGTIAAYCSDMVHSYIKWKIIQCSLKRGFLDCAGVMIKKDIAAENGWTDIDSHSADWTYFSEIITKYGADKWVKVNGVLLVHN